MTFFKDLYVKYFTVKTDLADIVMPHIEEASNQYDLLIHNSTHCDVWLKTGLPEAFGFIEVHIELQENGEYMVKVNNNNTVSDVPLGLINHMIFTELKMS